MVKMPEEHLGAYTDRPELIGKEGWTFVPGTRVRPGEEITPPKPTLPRPPSTLEGFVKPDYSDRDAFERQVLKELGANPFEIDPMKTVNVASKNIPTLFNHIFRGRVIWADRDKLDKKQAAWWDATVKQYRSDIHDKAVSNKNVLTGRYNWMMNKFDNEKKDYEARLKDYQTRLEDWYEAQEVKVPTLFLEQIKPEKGQPRKQKPYTGGPIPEGWRVVRPGVTTITEERIPGELPPMEKATKTRIEKEIQEADTRISAFKQMSPPDIFERGLFKDEYLTFKGQWKAGLAPWKEKLGMDIDEAWLDARQQWYQLSKAQFLAYRKWVTGVAGGEKEMAEIAKSYPDPDKNSPTEYKANLSRALKTTQFFRDSYEASLRVGRILSEKEVARLFVDSFNKASGKPPIFTLEKGKSYRNAEGEEAVYGGKDKKGGNIWYPIIPK